METIKQYLTTLYKALIGTAHKELNWYEDKVDTLQADYHILLDTINKKTVVKKKTVKKTSGK